MQIREMKQTIHKWGLPFEVYDNGNSVRFRHTGKRENFYDDSINLDCLSAEFELLIDYSDDALSLVDGFTQHYEKRDNQVQTLIKKGYVTVDGMEVSEKGYRKIKSEKSLANNTAAYLSFFRSKSEFEQELDYLDINKKSKSKIGFAVAAATLMLGAGFGGCLGDDEYYDDKAVRITTNECSGECHPDIWEDRIVLPEWKNGDYDIYMYDLATQEETQITDDELHQWGPAIWGDRIVWSDWRNDNSDSHNKPDIYMYDLATQEETQITSDESGQYNPDIWEDRIVWTDNRNGNYGYSDIYMYDLKTKEEVQITNDEHHQASPSIWEDRIVWTDDRNGDYDIYMYDLKTQEEVQVTDDGSDQEDPAIWGDRIVWNDERSGNDDIYMYDLKTKEEVQITNDDHHQRGPAIWKDNIVWYNSRDNHIYMLEYSPSKSYLKLFLAGVVIALGATGIGIVYRRKRKKLNIK